MPTKKTPAKKPAKISKSAQSAHSKKTRARKTVREEPAIAIETPEQRGVALIGPMPPKPKSIEEMKDEFITELEDNGGNVSRACEGSGLARRTAYDHFASDPEFAQKWQNALAIGGDEITQRIRNIASFGFDQTSLTALIYLDKKNDARQKWRGRVLDMGRIAIKALYSEAAELQLTEKQIDGLKAKMIEGWRKVPTV